MPVELPQWLMRLRRSGIVDRVRGDPRSTGGPFLGVDREVAVREVIGGGQADFDQPWNDLSADDRVLLYAYFNQLGHLEELAEAFRMLFADGPRPKNPIVVDLGCGPFTSGLAIATALGREHRIDYIGVDRSRAMRELGEKLASAAAEIDRTPQMERYWSSDVSSVTWGSAPGWRPVIVIVSYLLASPTLDPGDLIEELEGLLAKLGRGPVTVLYTNSYRDEPNRHYLTFRSALRDAGFDLKVEDTGSIEVERRDESIRREFRYALFHRGDRNTLRLGGNQGGLAGCKRSGTHLTSGESQIAMPFPPTDGQVEKTGVPGLRYVKDFLTEKEEVELVATLDQGEWNSELRRRVQHHGWRYDYEARKVDPSMYLGPLPQWADELARRLEEAGLVPQRPDQVIVNEYVGGQGISAHVDSPSFADGIATISLLESWEMVFREKNAGRKVNQALERRSVAIMNGDARYLWTHEIPHRKTEPGRVKRGRRISLTFRKVIVPPAGKGRSG